MKGTSSFGPLEQKGLRNTLKLFNSAKIYISSIFILSGKKQTWEFQNVISKEAPISVFNNIGEDCENSEFQYVCNHMDMANSCREHNSELIKVAVEKETCGYYHWSNFFL